MTEPLSPNMLRFVQCGLPDEVAARFALFLDDFELRTMEIEEQFKSFELNEKPLLIAALDAQVDMRKKLIEGGLVPELSSLDAIEDSLKLTSPAKGDDDPDVVSQDERKLGAAGIVCLFGRLFAKTNTTELLAFRELWKSVDGDFDAFLALGDGVAASLDGEFTLVQYNPKSDLFPYVNKTWTYLDTAQSYAKRSNYKQALLWTNTILPTTANNLKLQAVGYSSAQISRIFAREQPADPQASSNLSLSVASVKSLASLLLAAKNDPARSPLWTHESIQLEDALRSYITYRFNTYQTSYVFDVDYWEKLKASLQKKHMKELFENRPEVTGMALPTTEAMLGDLLTVATNLPIGSSVINSYMIKLADPDKDLLYEEKLSKLGTRLYTQLSLVNHPHLATVKVLLEEVQGGPISKFPGTPDQALNVADIKNLLNVGVGDEQDDNDKTASGYIASVNGAVNNSSDPNLAKDSLGTASQGDKSIKTTSPTNGLETMENFASILFRRVRWAENFVVCEKSFSKEKSGLVPVTQGTKNVGGVIGAASVGPAAAGATDASDLSTLGSEIKKNLSSRVQKGNENALRAKDRRTILPPTPPPKRKVDVKFEYKCSSKLDTEFTRYLAARERAFRKALLALLKALKELIIKIQDAIDKVIYTAQVILDTILGRLERLLTFDFHIGGKFGFENSLIKCSWDLDFGLKIDLFGELLKLLNGFFDEFFKNLRVGLKSIQDIITKYICIAVRLVESLIGGSNALLGLIGCSVKDIRLPPEILEFLKLMLASLDLRGLVLRKGYDAAFELSGSFKKHKNSFNGLTQFAALCQNVPMRDALNALDTALLKTSVTAPTKITDGLTGASDILKQNTVSNIV